MKTEFDSLQDVPTTDEEVRQAIMYGKSESVGHNAVGIFECYRAEGMELLAAYKNALLAILPPERR